MLPPVIRQLDGVGEPGGGLSRVEVVFPTSGTEMEKEDKLNLKVLWKVQSA